MSNNLFWMLCLITHPNAGDLVEIFLRFLHEGRLNTVAFRQLLTENPQFFQLFEILQRFVRDGDLNVKELQQLLEQNAPPKWFEAVQHWYSGIEDIVRYSAGVWSEGENLPYSECIKSDICAYCSCEEAKLDAEASDASGLDIPEDCRACPYRTVKFAFDHRPSDEMQPISALDDPYVGTMPPPPPSPTHTTPLREQPAPAGYYDSLHTRPASSTEQHPPVGYYHPWNYNP